MNLIYALRLATPTNPSRPEPNNQTAAGMGTAVKEVTSPSTWSWSSLAACYLLFIV